ncbi:MAG TPA: HNH endonuclease [Acidimicrobiaceae bacterium]|nr:HNH endonuclease [Acidimicrobiaceae bacterium]HCB37859.1 HNH endonuclease [Acidimicrobiaceae bacterium]
MSNISDEVHEYVLRRAYYRCQIRIEHVCAGEATEVDHIKPVTAGGSDDLDNLQAACGPCNKEKGDTWPWPPAA